MIVGKNDPGFIHNGPLAGLVAVCAGSDVFHLLGALATGLVARGFFVWLFVWCSTQKNPRYSRGWALHGVCGAWGELAYRIFGTAAFGGLGNVSFMAQLIGTIAGVAIAVSGA